MKTLTIVATVLVLAAVAVSGYLYSPQLTGQVTQKETNPIEQQETQPRPQATPQPETETVREFSFDSFVVFEDGNPKPQFSVKEMTVNKGDKIVLNINVLSGAHNFNIDEYNIREDTPTGQVTRIEFTADQAGEFVYYCNMPDHRANGHWGTLRVVDAQPTV